MSQDLAYLFIIPFSVIYIAAWVAMGYSSWVHPEKFLAWNLARVKDWWPLAGFYRRLFASKFYLWLARVGSVIGILMGLGMIFFTLRAFQTLP